MANVIDKIDVDGKLYSLSDKYAESIGTLSESVDVELINMFNKEDPRVRKGAYISAGNFIGASNAYFVTHPIKVNKGTTYKFHVTGVGAHMSTAGWTVDGVTIDETIPAWGVSEADALFTPGRTGYVLISSSNINTFMFCKDDKYPEIYTPYEPILPNAHVHRENLIGEQQKVTPSQTTFCKTSVNIFNKNNDYNLPNAYFSGNGVLVEQNKYNVTGPIYVEKGKTYIYYRGTDYSYGSNYSIMYVISESDMSVDHMRAGTPIDESMLQFTADVDGYVRLNTAKSFDELMVTEVDKYPDSYVPFFALLSDEFDLNERQKQTVNDVTASQIANSNPVRQYRSANLFNYQEAEDGYYFAPSTGNKVAHKQNSVAYVRLDGTGTYSTKVNTGLFGFTLAAQLPLFDKDYNYLGVAKGTLADTTTQLNDCPLSIDISNVNAYYAGFTVYTSLKQDIMFVKGNIYPDQYINFEEYSYIEGLKIQGEEDAIQDALSRKKISFNGDSICAGAGFSGGYGKIIAERNNMRYQNIGVGGGTITAEQYTSTGAARHWISRTIANMDADADYAIIEGGVNDSSLNLETGTPALGSLSSGYASVLDDTTFYGAFESMLKQLVTRFAGKKIGYIAVHQMTNNFRVTDNPETSFYYAAKKCCEKWGVPFLDLNTNCPPLRYIDALKNVYTHNGDGWHPNEEGYKKYYCDKIESWLLSL